MKSFLFGILVYTLFISLLIPTAFAQWEPAQRLTFNDSSSSTTDNNARSLAVNLDTIHVVWFDRRDANDEIYYKRSTDGGTSWGQDTRLTYEPMNSRYPSLASSGSKLHVAWYDFRDGNSEIYYKRSTDGGTSWGPDVRFSYNDSVSASPSLAVSDSLVHVVWEDGRDGRNREIYHKRSTNGGLTWGPDARLTSNSAGSYRASVAATGYMVHVVWFDRRDGNDEIYYKCSADGGEAWGPDVRLTSDSSESYYPCVSVSGSNVHVVWEDSRDGNDEIYYKRSTNGGSSWSLDSRLTFAPNFSMYPSITASGSMIHIAWFDLRGGDTEIYYIRSTDGGMTWDPETRITNVSSGKNLPSIAVSGAKVHLVWYDSRDGNAEIYYKRNPTGNIGVEENGFPFPLSRLPFSVRPNPFTSFTTLPSREFEVFDLYDISGRLIGNYRGDFIGADLPPGVYFLNGKSNPSVPVRIVKVR